MKLLDLSFNIANILTHGIDMLCLDKRKCNGLRNKHCVHFDITCEDRYYRLFSYKSYGLDMQMYNLICVTPIKDKILQACFNCPYEERELWEHIAQQVFLAMRMK